MKNRKKSGFSLVENMISCLVLATLSLGGSAAIFQTTSGINEQQVMRAAVEIANHKLENARSYPYFFLAPGTFDESDRFYLSWVEKSYEPEYEIDPITGETNSVKMVKRTEPGIVDVGSGGTPPEATTTVDGIQYRSSTMVTRWSSFQKPDFAPEHIEFTVKTTFPVGGVDREVVLSSLITPPELTL